MKLLFTNRLQLMNSFFLDETIYCVCNFFIDGNVRKNVCNSWSFLFGYRLGYHSFEIFKYKNKKHEINEYFSSYNRYMAPHSIEFLVKELDKIKISDDGFFGKDLTFLNKLIEKIEEVIEQQNVEGEVYFTFTKKV